MTGLRPPRRLGLPQIATLGAAAFWSAGVVTQSATSQSTMTVGAAVVRTCRVDVTTAPTERGSPHADTRAQVTLTCSQNTLAARRQTLTGPAGVAPDVRSPEVRTLSVGSDGRVVIQF